VRARARDSVIDTLRLKVGSVKPDNALWPWKRHRTTNTCHYEEMKFLNELQLDSVVKEELLSRVALFLTIAFEFHLLTQMHAERNR
jgi:hypothetical protein